MLCTLTWGPHNGGRVACLAAHDLSCSLSRPSSCQPSAQVSMYIGVHVAGHTVSHGFDLVWAGPFLCIRQRSQRLHEVHQVMCVDSQQLLLCCFRARYPQAALCTTSEQGHSTWVHTRACHFHEPTSLTVRDKQVTSHSLPQKKDCTGCHGASNAQREPAASVLRALLARLSLLMSNHPTLLAGPAPQHTC